MCGIAGILDLRGDVQPDLLGGQVTAMLELVRERGPDASGVWSGDGAVLGHRRLRIIDLSPEADQPMVSRSGNEVVVFNGEIYNHHALRGELEQRGHRFRTRCDTEVLLHGYQEWGEDLVRRLSGMFAFALLDRAGRRLLLARDRVGKKPLYYAFDPRGDGAGAADATGGTRGRRRASSSAATSSASSPVWTGLRRWTIGPSTSIWDCSACPRGPASIEV